jgi:starvation-inducible DNA-binding protein
MAKQPKDPSLHPTRNDLPADARAEMVEALNARLADAIDLMLQAKQAHWNVRGPNFKGLHGLFDEVSEAAEGWADLLAERAVQLGGTALGTARAAASRSTLGEYPAGARSGEEHVSAMTGALAHFCKKARASIEDATDALDAGTADLFTGVSREADKLLWMVEAHAG